MAKPGQADAARAKRGKRRVLFAASGLWLLPSHAPGHGESDSIAGQSQHQRLQHRSSPGSPVTVFARLTHRLLLRVSHSLPMPQY